MAVPGRTAGAWACQFSRHFIPRTAFAGAPAVGRATIVANRGGMSIDLMQSARACSGLTAGDIEGRVLKAVKKYIAMRTDELKSSEEDATGNKQEILEALKQDVSGTTNFDDLKFDELDKVEVLLEVEDEFQHIIPDDESEQMGTVDKIVSYFQKNAAA
eukprot:CAMPEP_0178448818 /NCGR_PEP_ID=MMETSP0689_2-20121128/42202_1 /TAXON_ID=160604 /ORGANISM="Amphidinium massartii, Strain CS-259" /LENGTH=158 /DNA_ID=CAMNT_0020074059 /DNA_START=10 /DNA_END=486 /DNA_ORIENTATION=+